MYLRNIAEVIAIRELFLTDGHGSKRRVKILIGKPEPFPDAEGHYCPFQISGVGSEEIRYSAGVDAVQALQLVMLMIGATLEFLAKEVDGDLWWDGDESGGFGFPSAT